ncbi:MAG: DNA repair protein RadC [Parasporobacterium sp.]|nr:DNA repair protein RadC [Parasporobacterium sp.]
MHNNTIKNLLPENRPDEKFINYGPKALSDAELLAIILRTGSAELSSVELARKILTHSGNDNISILNIFDYDFEQLIKIKGIGKVKAIQILAISELSLRISQSRVRSRLVFNDPETVSNYYMEQLRHEKRETVVLLLLDSACRLIKEHVLSTGTVNASITSARDIFITALKFEAVWMILLHNHPSGNCSPSVADKEFTEEIYNAGRLIGIKLLDHIIIGDNTYFSFREKELIHE